uniref:Uncharacterized protein n=1 Tax=Zea mays TaxID=4577 RepID=B6U4P1_MAIZE|nr:hypothetical protein [Zea mays]
MPHAKTDSEVTSLAPSSPPRSPPRTRGAVYYVQSPSRDSHDGETIKAATSVHSTPALSPMASPRHSHEEDHTRIVPRKCYCFLAFLLGFVALFSFFALVLWGASRSQKPRIVMGTIRFDNFIIQAGTDASLVPTDMATTNSTVRFTYRNRGTFFGIHVTADPFQLSYSQLTLASGDLHNFYQPRSSSRTVSVAVVGNKVPLYGGGPTLTAAPAAGGKGQQQASAKVASVPMVLRTTLHSRAYVLGALVKPKFTLAVECRVLMNPNKQNKPISLGNACHYS